jgi:hypothetical protein
MKTNSTLFLKAVVILLGISVFVFDIAALLGANSSDDISEFSPLLYVLVLSSLPFFYGLYQLMQLLKLIDLNKGFSELSVRALGNMKKCALGVAVVFTVGIPLVYFVGQRADAPGLIAFGLVMAFISIVIATFTAVLEMLVAKGFVIKNENDLTV